MDAEARGAHLGHRGQGALRVMNATEKAERVGLQALHPEADPIHPCGLPHQRPPRGDARRVGLHGHLGVGGDREGVAHRGHQTREQLGVDQRRGPAADEDGVERQPAEALAETRDLGAQRLHVASDPVAPATLVKSQYSHFRSQNGMCR